MNETKMFNVIFPIWMLIIFPAAYLIVLPGNFIIDSVVLIVGMFLLKSEHKKQKYKKTILLVWVFGFAADIIGSGLLLVTQVVFDNGWFYEYVTSPLTYNPLDNIYSVLYTLFAVVISAVLIYVFNRYISFRKAFGAKTKEKTLLALLLAILTAPYMFFVPTELLYGGNAEYFTNHIVWYDYSKAELYTAYDGFEQDILAINDGGLYDYTLAGELKRAVNTSERTDRTFGGESDFIVVFVSYNDMEDKMEEIPLWNAEGVLYFEFDDRVYRIKEDKSEKILELVEGKSGFDGEGEAVAF